MNITKKIDENLITINLKGRLDTNTSPLLENELNEVLSLNKDIEMNFKELEYISSSGLRLLLIGYKTLSSKGKTLLITNANEEIKEILSMTGFSDFLIIK